MTIWRRDDDDAVIGFDMDLTIMAMQASECPVLVRKDPEGDWWVIVQGPPNIIHAHVIHPLEAAAAGYASCWEAAIHLARQELVPWLALAAHDSSDPAVLRPLLVEILALLKTHREEL